MPLQWNHWLKLGQRLVNINPKIEVIQFSTELQCCVLIKHDWFVGYGHWLIWCHSDGTDTFQIDIDSKNKYWSYYNPITFDLCEASLYKFHSIRYHIRYIMVQVNFALAAQKWFLLLSYHLMPYRVVLTPARNTGNYTSRLSCPVNVTAFHTITMVARDRAVWMVIVSIYLALTSSGEKSTNRVRPPSNLIKTHELKNNFTEEFGHSSKTDAVPVL